MKKEGWQGCGREVTKGKLIVARSGGEVGLFRYSALMRQRSDWIEETLAYSVSYVLRGFGYFGISGRLFFQSDAFSRINLPQDTCLENMLKNVYSSFKNCKTTTNSFPAFLLSQ